MKDVDEWSGDAGAKTLLKDLTRKKADFEGKSLGAEGAKLVARYIGQNSALTELRLSYNSIGDAGAAAISTALSTNNTLTELDLSYNSIGDAMKAELKAIKAKSASLSTLGV